LFFIFIGALVYLGVHKKVASALDARVLLIRKELEEARWLAKKQITAHRRPRTAVARQWDNSLGVAGSVWIDRNTVMGALTPRRLSLPSSSRSLHRRYH
jgi:hypothetical protein